MNAGKLKTPILIQRRTQVITDSGSSDYINETICNSRCFTKDVSGELVETANELQYHSTMKLIMRFNKDITKDCEAIINGETYMILLVKEINRDIELTVKLKDK